MNTYKKTGEGVPNTSAPRSRERQLCPISRVQRDESPDWRSLPPSRAPRNASIPCALTRLRILPVTTEMLPLYPEPRKEQWWRRAHHSRNSGVRAFLRANSFVYKSLPPLHRLSALFCAPPSFVFNRLQPLFRKHPGWG